MSKTRARSAPIWNYFEVFDINDRKAVCNSCKNILSYKSTITNLKLHLRKKHMEVYEEFCRQTESATAISTNSDEDTNHSSQSNDEYNEVWSYYERQTGGRARCVVCRSSIESDLKKLKRHLKEKHPKLVSQLFSITEQDDNDIADGGDQSDVFTEVVYLDDAVNSSPEKKDTFLNKSPKKVHKRKKSVIKTRNDSTSSEEYVKKYKKVKDDDEIETFGTYITCLLKKMPRDVCRKLQMEIVNLIMTANFASSNKQQEKIVVDGVCLQKVAGSSYLVQQFDNTNKSAPAASSTPVTDQITALVQASQAVPNNKQ